jgi:hypothetical protein
MGIPKPPVPQYQCISIRDRKSQKSLRFYIVMLFRRDTNLDCIPFDIFYQITSSLDCCDFSNLSQVNKIIHGMMRNELIAKKSVEESCRLQFPNNRSPDRDLVSYVAYKRSKACYGWENQVSRRSPPML